MDNGDVCVTFRNKDGQEKCYSMSADTYHAVPIGDNATIEDYANIGEVKVASEKDA
jgi:hypothetical protein